VPATKRDRFIALSGQITDGVGRYVIGQITLGLVNGVLTFLLLLRSGYRWTRTLLTAGGVGTIVYTAMSLFGVPRETLPAVVFAVTGIIGSVLIGGGIVALHRPDAHGFFVR
jgi:predicted PurR-regulated permease PerM